MKKSHKSRVLRLQAKAFRHYGILPDQFLKLTPAEFSLIEDDALQELKAEELRKDVRVARLLAGIYNNNPNKKRGKVYSEKDFLPKSLEKKSAEKEAKNLYAKTRWIHIALLSKAGQQK